MSGCNSSIWNDMPCMLLAQQFTMCYIGYGHSRYQVSTCLWDTRYSGPVLPGVLWAMCTSYYINQPFYYHVALWPCWLKRATIKSPLVSLKTAKIQRWVTAVILQRKRELSLSNCAWDWELSVTSAEPLFCDLYTWSHCPHTRLYILKTRNQKSQKKLLLMTWLHPISKIGRAWKDATRIPKLLYDRNWLCVPRHYTW